MGRIRNLILFFGVSVLISSMIIPLNPSAYACGSHGTNSGNTLADWIAKKDGRSGLWELRLQGFNTLSYTSGEMCSCALQIPQEWEILSAQLVFTGTNDPIPGFPVFQKNDDLSDVLNRDFPSETVGWVALKNTIGSEEREFPGGDEADFVFTVDAPDATEEDIRGGLNGNQFSAGKVMGEGFDPNHFQILTLFDGIILDVDLKPKSTNNAVNLNGKGVIPIAIFSTESFDATTIDPESIVVEPGEAKITHKEPHIEDVNLDDRDDLVIHVGKSEILLKENGVIILKGQTIDGIKVKGFMDVVLKGKKVLEN